MAKKVVQTYEKKKVKRKQRHKKRLSKSEKLSFKKYRQQGRRP